MKKFSIFKTLLCGAMFVLGSTTVFGQSTYTLVTSENDLEAGAKYLVASGKTGSVKLLGYQNTNNRPEATAAVTVSDGEITVAPANISTDKASAYEITLGGTNGAWVLNDAINSIILGPSAGNGSNNYLKENAAATFSIIINNTSSVAAIKAVTGTNTQGNAGGRNNLRYNTNSGSGLFACYAGEATTSIADTYLFKLKPTCTAPVITTQPTDVSVVTGAAATFTVVATGDNLTYQWQALDEDQWKDLNYNGSATTASWNIPTTEEWMNNAKFRVVISSGTCSTISDVVTLAVTPPLGVENLTAKKITLVKNTIVSNELIFGATAKVSVYNAAGQVVKTAEVSDNSRLDVSALPKGTYVVTGVVNGQTVSQKIIKK